jgi:hypothetical protein
MPKVTLSTIGSRYGSIDALNNNFDEIEDAIENTLSRDGTSPNEMLANFNMGGNDIINVGDIFLDSGDRLLNEGDKTEILAYVDTQDNSVLAYVDAQDVALKAYVDAQDTADRAYADSRVSDAISNINFELVEGNVTSARYLFTAVGGETLVPIPYTNFTSQEVFKNGVHQNSNDYSVSGDNLIMVEPLTEGDRIYALLAFPMASGPNSVLSTQLLTATEGQTTFTLTTPVLANVESFVFINGVKQSGLAYTVAGDTLTFVSGLSGGDLVEVSVFVNVQEAVSVVSPVLLQQQIISSNTLIPTGFNGLSVDPTIGVGATVTISSGSVWAIVGA